ncbi:MAG TPA: dethiobiotin synthase [Desulfobacterales bacterium]|nr:dethiobiotin synthase [Desulfobacterales bacterium]
MDFPARFFITGTGTGVGKTMVAAILLSGLKYHYWKPIQSGMEEETDTSVIRRLSGLSPKYFIDEAYCLPKAASPHISAAAEGVEIEFTHLNLPAASPNIIVEGAGGLLVPINHNQLMIDLISYLQLPVIIVAKSGLGTINHTLLSLEALHKRRIPVLGVIMNGTINNDNRRAIEEYGRSPVLAEIEPLTVLNSTGLQEAFKKYFANSRWPDSR